MQQFQTDQSYNRSETVAYCRLRFYMVGYGWIRYGYVTGAVRQRLLARIGRITVLLCFIFERLRSYKQTFLRFLETKGTGKALTLKPKKLGPRLAVNFFNNAKKRQRYVLRFYLIQKL